MEYSKEELFASYLNGRVIQFQKLVDSGQIEAAVELATKSLNNGYREMEFYLYWASTLLFIQDPMNPPEDKDLVLIRDATVQILKNTSVKVDALASMWIISSLESLMVNPSSREMITNNDERKVVSILNINLAREINDVEHVFVLFLKKMDYLGYFFKERKEYWLGMTKWVPILMDN